MTDKLKEMRSNDGVLPTVSYGYSIYQGGENLDFSRILKEADDQMYHYKKAHKIRFSQDGSPMSLSDT